MNLTDKFDRYPLTFGTTPIEYLPRLTQACGGSVEIYAKRDDCNSGLAMGGNKLRKLEFIVPDALASGADTLVSIGGVQSNHTRMVAATAAKIGMKCRLVQESWVPHDDAVYDRVGNILLTRLMGADSRIVDDGFDIGIRKSWQDAMESVRAEGGIPYGIPAGASVHKYGGLGYVAFADQAGMIVGFKADGRTHRVIGIDASGTLKKTRKQVTEIARNTAELIELGLEITDDDIYINPNYAYPAYGVPSKETNEAIRLAARTEAMITDPVYEGKSMQGMIDLISKRYFPAGSKILYSHLGGAPALNGYSDIYRNG